MAIPAISITSRLSAYSCCAATAGYNWVLKEALGDPCWKEERRRYLFLSWAMGVLSRYHIEDDPCDCDGCVSEDFVNQVIALADPGCVRCACGTTTPPVDPCDSELLTPGITVGTFIAPFFFNIISDDPAYALAQNRTIRIEATTDGSTWSTVYNGQEQSIAQWLTISTNVNPPLANPINFRIWYIEGACEYGPVEATTFNNDPPFTNVVVGTTQFFPPTPGAPVFIYRGELYGTFTEVDDPVLPDDFHRIRTIRKADDIPSILVAGAEDGLIRYSWDSGATWNTPVGNWTTSPFIPDMDTASMTKVQCAGLGVFYIAGQGGVLLQSPDYGQTFNYMDQTGLGGASVRCVFGYDALTVLVGTASDGVWRTTDGGATWTKVLDINDQVTHLEAVGNNVMAFVSSGAIGCYRSTDAGLTWPAFPNTGVVEVNDTSVIGQTVYAVGDKRYKSVDAGQTWVTQENLFYTSVRAGSAQVVMYAGWNGNVFISFDGGTTIATTSVGAATFYVFGLEFHIYP